jgi:hypothetical protein
VCFAPSEDFRTSETSALTKAETTK